MNIGTLTVLLGVNTAGLSRAAVNMRRFEKQVLDSNKRIQATTRATGTAFDRLKMKMQTMGTALSSTFSQIGSRMTLTGAMITQYFTVPLGLLSGIAVKAFADFESGLAKVTGLVGIASEQTRMWGEELLKMGKSVGQAPDDLVQALYRVTSGGVRTAQSIDIVHKSALAATAGFGEMEELAKLTTHAMNAYGRENITAAHAMDVFVAAVREGQLEATDFVNNLGKVFPVAVKLGVSLEEVTAAVASLTRTGTSASESATQVRRLLSTIIQATPKANRELQRFGLSFDDLRKRLVTKGLLGTLKELKLVIGDDVEAFGNIFTRLRALLPVLDMLGPNLKYTEEIFEAAGVATGSFNHFVESASDTIKFRWAVATKALNTSLTELGRILKEPVISLVERFINFAGTITNRFKSMTTAQQRNVLVLAGLATILGPVLIAFGHLIIAFRTILSLALGTHLAGIATQLIVLGGAAYYVYKNWDLLNQAAEKFLEKQGVKSELLQIEQQTRNVQSATKIWNEFTSELNSGSSQAMQRLSALQEQLEAFTLIDSIKGNAPKDIEEREGQYLDIIRVLKEMYAIREQLIAQAPITNFTELTKFRKANMQIFESLKKIASAAVDKELYEGAIAETNVFKDFFVGILKDMKGDAIAVLTELKEALSNMKLFEGMSIDTMFNLGGLNDVQRKMEPLKKLKKFQEIWSNEILADRPTISFTGTPNVAFMEIQNTIDGTNEKLKQNAEVAKKLGENYNKVGTDIDIFQKALSKLTTPEMALQLSPEQLETVKTYLKTFEELNELQDVGTDLTRDWARALGSFASLGSSLGNVLGGAFGKFFDILSKGIRIVSQLLNFIDNVTSLVDKMKAATAASTAAKTAETAAVTSNTGAVVANTAAKQMNQALDTTGIGTATGLSVAKAALAVSSAVAAGAWVPFPGNLAAIAAGVTAVESALAAGIPAAMSLAATGLAEGGLIPGGFPNDTFPAMLTSGEAVIPLKRLHEFVGGDDNGAPQKVVFKIKGRTLEGVLVAQNAVNKVY